MPELIVPYPFGPFNNPAIRLHGAECGHRPLATLGYGSQPISGGFLAWFSPTVSIDQCHRSDPTGAGNPAANLLYQGRTHVIAFTHGPYHFHVRIKIHRQVTGDTMWWRAAFGGQTQVAVLQGIRTPNLFDR